MKKILLMAICTMLLFNAGAQKLEVSVQANSTLSHFRGSSTVSDTYIQEGYAGPDSTKAGNPYGKKYAIGFNIGLQTQIVTKSGFIAGVGVGYELLRSHVNITAVAPAVYFIFLPNANSNYATYNYTATGSVNLNSSYINLSPYVGYRIKIRSFSFDLLPGAEFALALSQKEKGTANATTDNREFTSTYRRKKLPVDTRLKLGINANYQNFTIDMAYAHGLSNYNKNTIYPTSGSMDIKSELFRLGIGYRLL